MLDIRTLSVQGLGTPRIAACTANARWAMVPCQRF